MKELLKETGCGLFGIFLTVGAYLLVAAAVGAFFGVGYLAFKWVAGLGS